MQDVAEFLSAYAPFGSLEEADIDRLAECAKVESFAAGTIILGRVVLPLTRSG
jgi:signal-transduction protein with cAMP-binding, CBS, and nucleotidyltransferase domain